MGRNLNYFLFTVWLCYLIVSSIFLFTRGFLLTRVVQDKNSSCAPINEIFCTHVQNDSKKFCSHSEIISNVLKDYKTTSTTCLPARGRVVLLIVDALRYDFIIFDEKNKHPLPFQNKLPVINKLTKKYPEHTRLYKFIADPPTTTMQRIKGFTTGSLPTFIDAGSNFATMEINEDNIIDQMIRNNYKVVFMGDDTWKGLYPNRFMRNYPYPSFNVWDLDTVDNGVRDHLFQELNKTDWNLLIGHFLGVDHCGHRYGPSHPEMERKLGEINTVIENVVEQVDDTTMVFVIGDHGMTVTGDHGGESEEEVTAGFFVYSKQSLLNLDDTKDYVKQVDIVPTLAAILGVPVPFQNLGILILDCLPLITDSSKGETWRLGLYYLWVNVNQVLNYIKEYSESTNTFSKEILSDFYQKYSSLKTKLIFANNEKENVLVYKDIVEFLFDLRKMCEDVWVQFDSYSMTRGLLFLFTSLFFAFVITDGIPYNRIPAMFSGSFVSCSYIILFLSAASGFILYYFELVYSLLGVFFFATGIVSQMMFVILIIQNWEIISLNWYVKNREEKISNLIFRVVLVFNICGLFSNSYIIEESFVLLFLLVTVILVGTANITLYGNMKIKFRNSVIHIFKWSKLNLLILSVCIGTLVRVSMYFWRCREEQQWCFGNPHEINNIISKIGTTKVQWSIAVVSLAVLVFMAKEWLRHCKNLNGYSLTVILVKFAPTVTVVCIGGYWSLKRFSSNKGQLNAFKSADVLAWIAYALTLIGIVATIIKPLCPYLIPRRNSVNEEDKFPILCKKIRNTLMEKPKSEQEIPIICGLGTVYSSAFIMIGIYVTLVFGLLLSDSMAPSAVIMFITAVFILIITSILRIEKAASIEQLFDIPNILILVWIILAQYFFYATGHQPTFPNISWEAAFVGTSGIFFSHIVQGALIIINTFCSYILMGLLLPLLLITPFTVLVMMPSVIGRKSNDFQLAFKKGEMVLIERNNLTLSSIFILSCKYIMGHGIRVCASMLAATIHCRHLMVWRIFAPKFLFESIGMFVTLISVLIGYLILTRINRKVENFIVTPHKFN